jgi:hypothetical protein
LRPKDGIDRITYASKSPFESSERFGTEVQVAFVKPLWCFRIRASINVRALQFFAAPSELRLG